MGLSFDGFEAVVGFVHEWKLINSLTEIRII